MTTCTAELLRGLFDLGGSVTIAVVFGYLVYRILARFGQPFIEAQSLMAQAMCDQAKAMCEMKDSVHEFTGRDSSEHREILLALQVVGQEMADINRRLAGKDAGGYGS